MTHRAEFTGGPLKGTSQERTEDQGAALLVGADHALHLPGAPGQPDAPIGTYRPVAMRQEPALTVVVYEWHDPNGITEAAKATAGERVNALMERLIAVARRNEDQAEAVTVYEPGGAGREPAWRIGYRDRVSDSRRVVWGPSLEGALEVWLSEYE
ncbi:MAG: hypothetical protein M3063_10755 [Actinomycetota bacterium]|nr:hypothetical protein [Actinomycetota bacterium]